MSQMALPSQGLSNLSSAWTDNRITQVSSGFTSWSYVAIDSFCRRIAEARPSLYAVRTEEHPGNKKRWLNKQYRRKSLLDLKPHEDLEPIDDHPLIELLDNPNEMDTAEDLWYETVLFLMLTGNSYWWIPENDYGLPA